ncbi:biopolymer transporter ExbD [Candidatus Pelagadaptatus aseana]|uniref:biopolymer transporter ExbD n=1 Tax=Candidatus Pelagadaptatus aseana TaxID=3120508 RepID=UPI003C705C4E
MTALLDVIFILLVFLLLTANTVPEALEVSLPADSEGQAQSLMVDQQVSVTLFKENDKWGLADTEYSGWHGFESALLQKIQALKSADKQPEIIISGDKNASLEKTLKLFAWLQKHDLSAAHIVMNTSN